MIFIIWISARWLIHQVLKGAVHANAGDEREERIETLNRASRSGLTVLILIFGAMAILSEFGIDISVLLGGAAVFSLAIAFGAQSLVKDYFSGFMILSENQYRVGNVVKINQIAGLVEDISLRKTTLRDLEGVAHFIPHGEITIVSNLTHQWSRVMLDIGVAYKENVDQVMDVIMHTARKMRDEPEYSWLITEDPEMLGVDAFADSAIIIKVIIQTRPLKQWIVKRELLRRIKNRFDELGIEIPFPHRTVYHRDLTFNGHGDKVPDQDQLTK
jgi:small conductance mechanosensitive channel